MKLELRDAVALLRFDHDDNRFNTAFLDEFESALERANSLGAGALVTVGSGRFYSTGLDLAWLSGEGRDQAGPFVARVHRLLARILALPLFTVAAINGHAFAAGAMLALAHDVRIMRQDRGYFCLPEIDLATGRPLTPGMVSLIAARLSPQTFHRAIATGRRYGGHEAATAGIVQRALPEGELIEHAMLLAASEAKRDPETRSALKRGLYRHALASLAAPLVGFA